MLVVHDPDYLAGPWELSWKKYYVAGYNFTESDCRLPFFANQLEPRLVFRAPQSIQVAPQSTIGEPQIETY